MSPLVIGKRLPSPYFEWIQAGLKVYRRVRKCRACGHLWSTAEVPITKGWMGESPRYCPIHNTVPARVVAQTSLDQLSRQDSERLTVFKIISYGGNYKRYECKVPGCWDPKIGKPIRWTTMEVSGDGIVVSDVNACPNCLTGKGRLQKERRQPKSRDNLAMWKDKLKAGASERRCHVCQKKWGICRCREEVNR